MATNYQRGRQFEYRSRDKALKLGASYVMRAASSKGAADLIVLWPAARIEYVPNKGGQLFPIRVERFKGDVWLVQCKRDGKLPRAEREELIRLAEETGAIPVLARVPKAGRGVEFTHVKTKETLGNT